MKHLKSEFDKLTFKEFYSYVLATICLIAGIALVFIGLYIPPQGELHPTVITTFGLCLGFAGALVGISNHFENQLTKFKYEIKSELADSKEHS